MDSRAFPERVERFPRTTVAIVDFDPRTGRVEHVGMRGRATLDPFDTDRAHRLLERYLGDDRNEWDEMFVGLDGDEYRLIRVEPETIVARDQSYDGSLG